MCFRQAVQGPLAGLVVASTQRTREMNVVSFLPCLRNHSVATHGGVEMALRDDAHDGDFVIDLWRLVVVETEGTGTHSSPREWSGDW